MKPRASTSIILAVLTIGGGRMVQNKEPVFTDRMIVGSMIVVLGISIANQYSPGFADVFAFFILIAAFLVYGLDLMKAIGFKVKEGE